MHTITVGAEVPNLRDKTLEKVVWCDPDELEGVPLEELEHSDVEIDHFQRTIYDYNGAQPIVIDDEYGVVAGRGRVEASCLLGVDQIPAIRLSSLMADDLEHYIDTLIRFGSYVGWTREMLEIDLQHLLKVNAIVQAAKDDANSRLQ